MQKNCAVLISKHHLQKGELAERSLMSPLAGMKHTYVRLAIIIHCQILTFFQVCEWHITQLGILM